jgi:hypothetical protein
MTAAYDTEQSSTERSPVAQIAITLFLGIPMTLALVIGLVFYCSYECLKFALSAKSSSNQPVPISDEQKFTKTLTQFARVHKSARPVVVQMPKLREAQKDLTPVSGKEITDQRKS